MLNLKKKTSELLEGSIIIAHDNTKLYTPDGMGDYPALWTRDFAYMVEYAGELIPNQDKEACVEYLLSNVDHNGWIPDRVEAGGEVWYTAGDSCFPASPNLDNGCFMVIAALTYLNTIEKSKADALFERWNSALCRGIDCIPTDKTGLVVNEAVPPHSPYGFTDCVAKTGLLCMESILLWKALKLLCKWLIDCGFDCTEYKDIISSIEHNLSAVFTDENGLLLSATGKCRQPDLWASCFAVAEGFPLESEQKEKISKWFCEHYDEVTDHGHLRHLPKGMYWEEMFIPVDKGTYQNGAFWATPSGWLFETLRVYDENLAMKQISEILTYFETKGIFECVNGEERKLDKYVASITAIYGVCKRYGEVEQCTPKNK